MFTFIKKVIKTGAQTSSYPLEPMPVDKNFRGKPEHNPQQCIGCAACVNACPSNALTVETFAVQKEIDYAIALLKHNGDVRAEHHRESFETCPECKRQKCLLPSDRIDLTRHMREAS